MNQISLSDIKIRTDLRPGDMGYVTYMHGHLYEKEYGFGPSFEIYVSEGFIEFFRQYNPVDHRVWVCEHIDRIVGFMLLMRRGESAQLRFFIIDPEYRGIGLGKRLMELYMAFLKSCQYKSSYLWTTDELGAARSLYERHGFKLTEQKESSAFGKPLRELRFDLTL